MEVHQQNKVAKSSWGLLQSIVNSSQHSTTFPINLSTSSSSWWFMVSRNCACWSSSSRSSITWWVGEGPESSASASQSSAFCFFFGRGIWLGHLDRSIALLKSCIHWVPRVRWVSSQVASWNARAGSMEKGWATMDGFGKEEDLGRCSRLDWSYQFGWTSSELGLPSRLEAGVVPPRIAVGQANPVSHPAFLDQPSTQEAGVPHHHRSENHPSTLSCWHRG